MPVITLPDGSQKSFDRPVTVAEVAASIGKGLAKAALAGGVDGRLVDTSQVLDSRRDAAHRHVEGSAKGSRYCATRPRTCWRRPSSPSIRRHRSPSARSSRTVSTTTLRSSVPSRRRTSRSSRQKMREIVKADQPVHRRVLARDAAVAHFKSIGEHYKAEIIAAIPAGEEISLYGQGEWEDLCRGPHVPSTGQARRLQADQGRRRVLARRFPQRNAPAHLRHGLARREAAQGLPAAARGGREAGPPAHRPRTRPVPLPGRGAGRSFLAPARLDDLPAADRLHARASRPRPATRRSAAPRSWTASSGCSRATSRSSARTCS